MERNSLPSIKNLLRITYEKSTGRSIENSYLYIMISYPRPHIRIFTVFVLHLLPQNRKHCEAYAKGDGFQA